jgi:O-antigen ligase
VIVGLLVLALLQPLRPQLRAMAVAVVCAAPAVAVSAVLHGVRTLEGSGSARRTEGLVMLAVLLLTSAAAALAIGRGPGARATGRVSARARRGVAIGGALVAIGVVVMFGVLAAQHQEVNFSPADGPENARLASAESIRGDFWRVARHSFADEPLRGVGSGGFAVAWLRQRPIQYATRDAHSLYLETAAELGLVGIALLLTFAGGVAASARRAFRRDPALAAGPVAVVCAWAVHAGLDWDWEVPSLTLVAILLAAVLVARADEDEPEPVAPRPSVEERAPEPRRAEVAL